MRQALIHTTREPQRVSQLSILYLVGIMLDIERRWGAAPFDEWDGVLLEQMRVLAKRRLEQALEATGLPYAVGYEIVA